MMDPNDQTKVKLVCAQVAILMEHQEILPDLKEIVAEMKPNCNDYLMGAQDALTYLIGFLEQKGNR